MEVIKPMSLSDDEEDLEALRLAALQSLKKRNVTQNEGLTNQGVPIFLQHSEHELRHDQALRHGNRHHGNFSGKRGRFYCGRGSKNGQFNNNRVRSSNLISITPVGSEDDKKADPLQNRYNSNKSSEATKSNEITSKFDRFNDSDKSEDESEEETNNSNSDDSPMKLERSDSLEALMQELDDEIQGRPKTKEKPEKPAKVKSKTKRKKEKASSETEIEGDKVENKSKVQNTEEQKKDDKTEIDTKQETIKETLSPREKSEEREPQFKKRRLSPPGQRDFYNYLGKSRNFKHSPPYQKTSFLSNTVPVQYPAGNVPPVFTPAFGTPNLVIPPLNPPPFYERPISPLHINADTLQTQTMAPLSPRSAAFVLENRAIIEKRKRSPRRSYSRSPSPRSPSPRSPSPRNPSLRRRSLSPRSPRRSLSPRRTLSPRRRSRSPKRRSLSPRKRSPSPRHRPFSPKPRQFSPKPRQFSPKLRPFSPKRRSPSPRRRSVSPRRRDRKEIENSPKLKPSIRDRLGFKSSSKSDNKEVKDRSPSPKKDNKPLDPILEARKRKFEAKEIKVREGVIRLKPKEEQVKEEEKLLDTEEKIQETKDITAVTQSKVSSEPKEQNEEDILNEDALLEDDELELEPKVDLFSDEESGSENEGRFKAKEQSTVKPAVVPFSKLINGAKKEVVKQKPLIENRKKQFSDRISSRSRSPYVSRKGNDHSDDKKPVDSVNNIKKPVRPEKSSVKKRIMLKSERHPTPKRFERKIEIKIKNPAKYEKEEKPELEKHSDEKAERGVRKVELGNFAGNEAEEDDDFETEIVVENDEDEVENTISSEGDLRAQLSKKRAEKLQKTTSEGVASRLLQNALQKALPMKKSKRKSKELSSSDGKLPIHLRLGIACSSDVFTKPKRKSRKRKNLETEDQV